MIFPAEQLAVLSGLGSAISWGIGDFSGGMGTRKGNVYSTLILSELIGMILMAILALAFHESLPPLSDLAWAGAAGVSGTLGLAALYQAMSDGQMGVAAPVSAVLAAALPALAGSILQGIPGPLKLVGFALGFTGLWLISQSEGGRTLAGFRLALLAGIGFSGFFILINQATKIALFWPLVASRSLAFAVITIITLVSRRPVATTRPALPWVVLAGACDVGGNVFFALAAQIGRLDLSAVLSSAAPMFTIILALLVVKEKLSRWQVAGIALMLAAVALFAIKEAPLT